MKRVLVTGATGFVGRHTLSNLIGRGFEVFAVSSRPETEQIDGVQWLRADLLNADRAESVVAETRPSHLLHLAWHPSVPGKFWNAPENFSWVQASIDLLDAFVRHGGRRVVSAGTCAEYDWNYGLCVENRTPLNPRTPYGVCKHGLQAWQSALCEQAGVSSAWGRPFLMYGPFEHPGRLVASVINALLTGRPALCSAGTQIRDLMHIQDVADAFAALLDSDVDGPVNIASGTPVELRDAVACITDIAGKPPATVQFGAIASAPGDPPRLLADTSRMRTEVGWEPRWDLERGLKQTIDWWRERCRA